MRVEPSSQSSTELWDRSVRAQFDHPLPIAVAPSSRWAGPHVQLRFKGHYEALRALPRRTRRSIERRWRRSLAAVALALTLAQAPAWAATINVAAGTPPSIDPDGSCSLLEALANANADSRVYVDCVAGAGIDQIVLPANSLQQLKFEETLTVSSAIVLEGRDSTIRETSKDTASLTPISAWAPAVT